MKGVEDWRLYVITDRKLSLGRTNEEVIRHAIAGGTDVVQLRDKEASTAAMYREAVLLRNLTKTTGTPLIINDRIDIALAVDADGVHLGQEDLPVSVARKLLGPDKLIGISTHSLEQALTAILENPDYVSIGPVFSTQTKKAGPPVGTGLIRQLKKKTHIPVIAIGGIGLQNVREVFQSGADCVAIVSSIVSAENVEESVRRFIASIQSHS